MIDSLYLMSLCFNLDLDKLALSTPDLDLYASKILADTRTTNDLPTYSRQCDDSKQSFAEALLSMQNPPTTTLPPPPPPVTMSMTTVDMPTSVSISSSGLRPVSLGKPVNLQNQEELKLQRKRFRNRLAATKCRQKKLERIQYLERRKSLLAKQKEDQLELIDRIERLVAQCQEHLNHHIKMGCGIELVHPINM